MRKILRFCLVTLVTFTGFFSSAQNANPQNQRLKVFIDCKSWSCPFDFIRSEIKFVDYVNDRFSSDVYVLITTASTGGGGREYKLFFEGFESFRSVHDTLTYIRSAVETDDEDRRKMVQTLKLGLVPFLARTAIGPKIQITIG